MTEPRHFQCAICKELCQAANTLEEAHDEARAIFKGEIIEEDKCSVCDDCWREKVLPFLRERGMI